MSLSETGEGARRNEKRGQQRSAGEPAEAEDDAAGDDRADDTAPVERAATIAEMRRKLLRYEERERRHLAERRASETALAVFQDKVETLAAVMDGQGPCETPGEVAARLQSVFADGESGVTFATVHQAKGLEAERVFIARPDLMPLARVRQEWELQQELNIEYVAYTRSKSELYFLEGSE